LMCAALAACTTGERPLRLGTTHTVEQSGALAVLDSLAHPMPATVIGPSGQILAAAARGDLDVVITHAPSLERRLLVEPGHVLLACPFVASRFAIVGPPADPARVAAAPRAADAFRRIAAAAGPFVSRGDSSGTHVKELALWDAAGVRPPAAGGWYLQAGADQATTLHVADERNARSEEHTSELQSPCNLVCRLLLEKKKTHKHMRSRHPATIVAADTSRHLTCR